MEMPVFLQLRQAASRTQQPRPGPLSYSNGKTSQDQLQVKPPSPMSLYSVLKIHNFAKSWTTAFHKNQKYPLFKEIV